MQLFCLSRVEKLKLRLVGKTQLRGWFNKNISVPVVRGMRSKIRLRGHIWDINGGGMKTTIDS